MLSKTYGIVWEKTPIRGHERWYRSLEEKEINSDWGTQRGYHEIGGILPETNN